MIANSPPNGRRVVTHRNVEGFFHEALTEALERQHVEARAPTVHYVSNLLAQFTRAERFLERNERGRQMPVLALYYKRAVETESTRERIELLRRLGDVSLFVAGVFADSLNRKLVDIDYYIAMGGNAYGWLAERSSTGEPESVGAVYQELAEKFTEFVDVLDEVHEHTHCRGNRDIMRLYERWLRTGSPRAAKRLARLGVVPAPGSRTRSAH